jgi:C-terminal processing protease CtpA/Prc
MSKLSEATAFGDALNVKERVWKMNKGLSVLMLCLVLIVGGCSRSAKKLYIRDAENLVETMEITHPMFSLDEVTDRYRDAKNAFLNEAKNQMTYNDFVWNIQKYCASLNDGHTEVDGKIYSMFIDIKWKAVGDSLFLLDSDGVLTDSEIVSVGGVPVDDIFKTVDSYYPIENEIAKERNRALWSRSKDILLISGSAIDKNSVSIVTNGGAGLSEISGKIKKMNIYDFYNHFFNKVSSKVINNVFYIDYNNCELGKQLSGVITKLEQAISDGITSVIIDARDNPGGDSEANKALLAAMGMVEPQYGIYLRYSPLLSKQWGREETSGATEFPRDISIYKKNPNINLVVLINENTYSGAMLLGVTVQDGPLGTIIGRPSSNAPNCYGDVLVYTLPDSKIKVRMSCKKYLRPDENANPRLLTPDIMTEYNVDALAVALDFLGAR